MDTASSLEPEMIGPDPLDAARRWFDDALEVEEDRAAMAIATTDAQGHPRVRMVLLRGLDERGFTFYTNLEGAKGRELLANPSAAGVLYHHRLGRQLRFEGRAEVVSDAEADAYFASRPRGHQLSAWASHQSAALEDRSVLEAAQAEVEARFTGVDVPRPSTWSGFRVDPHLVEFFVSRSDRLHDRLCYRLEPEGWTWTRLSP